MPLAQALQQRRSAREFAVAPLSLAEFSQLLWSAQGTTASWGGLWGAQTRFRLQIHEFADWNGLYAPDTSRTAAVRAQGVRKGCSRQSRQRQYHAGVTRGAAGRVPARCACCQAASW
jgi:hypothetical protein